MTTPHVVSEIAATEASNAEIVRLFTNLDPCFLHSNQVAAWP